MKRAAMERGRTVRTWRRHVELNRGRFSCASAPEAGRFRKGQKVGGCANAACWLCHADKLSGERTLQERRSLLSLGDGLADVVD